jgi:hypothetical protein
VLWERDLTERESIGQEALRLAGHNPAFEKIDRAFHHKTSLRDAATALDTMLDQDLPERGIRLKR